MAKPFFRKDTNKWYVRHKGEKHLVGVDKKAADILASKMNIAEAEGRAGIHRVGKKSIESFFQERIQYGIEHRNWKKKTVARYSGIANNFRSFLTYQYPLVENLSHLTTEVFEKYIRHRRSASARDRTIKGEISTLKTLLNDAVKNRDPSKRYLDDNPIDYISPIKVKNKKTKNILTPEQAKRFLDYMQQKDKELFEIYFTLLHTGMRDGELRHLEWKDVSFERGVITLQAKQIQHADGTLEFWEPKTIKGRREIPIHEKLLDILRSRSILHSGESDFVFPNPNGGILKTKLRRKLMEAMKDLGIENFTEVHGLRRTFISFMAMQGVDKETTMDIVGHVDEETYELYRQSTTEHRVSAVNRLNIA